MGGLLTEWIIKAEADRHAAAAEIGSRDRFDWHLGIIKLF